MLIKEAEWICSAQKTGEVCPVFRKSFRIEKPVKSATLRITALGVYEAHLNGERVGRFILAPGWTVYPKRLQVQEYDVTGMLEEDNVLTVTVGKGWFRGRIARNVYDGLADDVCLLAQLEVRTEDGAVRLINTDDTWESDGSPIRFSDIYDGETYDARVTPEHWERCMVAQLSKDMLIPQEGEEIVEHERLKPVSVIHTPAGETVLDFGQEITGYLSFSVCAEEGDEILISHAEVLDKDGNFYTDNLRTAKAQLRVICREGEQTYKPHHTFMGFRYVRLDRFPGEVDLSRFTAIVVHSDIKRTGDIQTSSHMLNRLFQNIIWGQKGNFLDIPTDCPQRDERLGWTGDAQMFARAAACNFDVERFFRKWLHDLAAEQREDGAVPYTIPSPDLSCWVGDNFCSGSAWADAAVICPWQMYRAYGNREMLRENLPMMKKWVDYIHAQGDDEFLWNTGHQYGDWLGLDAKEGDYTGASDPSLIATAYFAYSTSLLVKTLDALGENSGEYRKLYKNVAAAFRRTYPVYHTQTEYALALSFGLAENPEKAAGELAEMIHRNGDRLTTGFVGTPYLLHALSENGYTDVAYTLLLQEEFPSWLFSVRMGATTMWEHWDGRKEDGSFWSTDMNSFNHYAYGAVADWMYAVAGGIQIDEEEPAYRHILLEPKPDARLEWYAASIQTRLGEVRSEWKWSGNEVHFEFDVPTSAEIRLADQCHHVGAGHFSYVVKMA